jgi:CBS domain-containing protein
MYVKEVMTGNVKTLDVNDKIIDAILKYKEFKIGSFLVKKNNKCVGIVTERDLIEKTIGLNPEISTIREIMSSNLVTIGPLDKIEKAVELMKENNVKKLPVISEDKGLEGIITITDIAHRVPEMTHKVEKFFWEWESPK